MFFDHTLVGSRPARDFIGYHGVTNAGERGRLTKTFDVGRNQDLAVSKQTQEKAIEISADKDHVKEYDHTSVKSIFFAYYGVRLLFNKYDFGGYEAFAGSGEDRARAKDLILKRLKSIDITVGPKLPQVARSASPVVQYLSGATHQYYVFLSAMGALPPQVQAATTVSEALQLLLRAHGVVTLEMTDVSRVAPKYYPRYNMVKTSFDLIPGMHSATWRSELGVYCAEKKLDSKSVIERSLRAFSGTMSNNILCNGSLQGQVERMITAANTRTKVLDAMEKAHVGDFKAVDFMEGAVRRWGAIKGTSLSLTMKQLLYKPEVFSFFNINKSADPGPIYHGIAHPVSGRPMKREDVIISELAMCQQLMDLAAGDKELTFLRSFDERGERIPGNYIGTVMAKPKTEPNDVKKVAGGWRSIYVTSAATQIPLHVAINAGKAAWCDQPVMDGSKTNNSLYGFSPFHGGISDLIYNLKEACERSDQYLPDKARFWLAGYSDNLYVYSPADGGTLLSLDGSKFESGATDVMGEGTLQFIEACAPSLGLESGCREYLLEVLTRGSINTQALLMDRLIHIGGMCSGTACTFLLNHLRMMFIVNDLLSRNFWKNFPLMFPNEIKTSIDDVQRRADETPEGHLARLDRLCESKRKAGESKRGLREKVAGLIPFADMELESTSDDHPMTPRERDFHHWPFTDFGPPDEIARTGRIYVTNLDLLGFDVCYYPIEPESSGAKYAKMAVLARGRLLKSAVLRNRLDTSSRVNSIRPAGDGKSLIHNLVLLTGRACSILNLFLMGAYAYPSIYSVVLAEWCGVQFSISELGAELREFMASSGLTLGSIVDSVIKDVLSEGPYLEGDGSRVKVPVDHGKRFVANLASKVPEFMHETVRKCIHGEASTRLPTVTSVYISLHRGFIDVEPSTAQRLYDDGWRASNGLSAEEEERRRAVEASTDFDPAGDAADTGDFDVGPAGPISYHPAPGSKRAREEIHDAPEERAYGPARDMPSGPTDEATMSHKRPREEERDAVEVPGKKARTEDAELVEA